jgi:sterol desaturase/sphingolipid hydroxylase (fatty acid hydroxylase superfamily)
MANSEGRLFKNPFLERLTHTHIAIPLTIFYGTALFLFIYTFYTGLVGPLSSLGAFIGGFLLFTLVEYFVHRYAFHIDTDTEAKKQFQYAVHGVHHDFPRDKSRLAMPPILSVLLATLFFLLYRYTMGYVGLPFAAGFMAGYATYLVVHYATHAYRPPKNFLKILWKHHAIHHFSEPDRAFGVSSPLWDVIFRTMPTGKKKAKA